MKTISLKLPDELHARLERSAQRQGQGKSEVVRTALEQYLKADRAGKTSVSLMLQRAGNLIGCLDLPADLSTNPHYMEGLGE